MLGHRPHSEETDSALDALSHACRRRLLFELYEKVISGEGEAIDYTEVAQLRTETRQLQLYHVHLPKLEESGYIDWNRSERTIRKGPRWEKIEPLLELIYSHLYEPPRFLQGRPPNRDELKS